VGSHNLPGNIKGQWEAGCVLINLHKGRISLSVNNNGNIYSHFFLNVLFLILHLSLVLVFDVYCKCKFID
jgi:hypothetical protein